MMRAALFLLIWMGAGADFQADVRAEDMRMADAEPVTEGQKETIVQILGPRCEYHRAEVEGALRRFDAVHAVRFLNNHGTVLIRYRPERVAPVQLADAIGQALPIGVGCKTRVE